MWKKRQNTEMSPSLGPQLIPGECWAGPAHPSAKGGALTGETGISSSLPGWIALENTEIVSQKYREYREFCVVFRGIESSWSGAVVKGAVTGAAPEIQGVWLVFLEYLGLSSRTQHPLEQWFCVPHGGFSSLLLTLYSSPFHFPSLVLGSSVNQENSSALQNPIEQKNTDYFLLQSFC